MTAWDISTLIFSALAIAIGLPVTVLGIRAGITRMEKRASTCHGLFITRGKSLCDSTGRCPYSQIYRQITGEAGAITGLGCPQNTRCKRMDALPYNYVTSASPTSAQTFQTSQKPQPSTLRYGEPDQFWGKSIASQLEQDQEQLSSIRRET